METNSLGGIEITEMGFAFPNKIFPIDMTGAQERQRHDQET